jgi:ParB family chromosome partitioning protein
MRSTAPLDKLYVSDLNVRKTDRALDIEPLADNIAAHGLIEPLVVVDEGMLGVVAGSRHFHALQLLASSGKWPADRLNRNEIPVVVRAARGRGALKEVAWEQLYLSEQCGEPNDATDIEQLAADIIAQGIYVPLEVVEEGRLGVIAGGRRLLALQLLARANDWPDGKLDRKAIPVTVRALEEAREISLSENVHSVVMNPVDELEAYAAIIADYEKGGEDDPAARILRCARHFGRTERYVEQRLRLAALADEIRAALREGRIGIEAAKAYAQTGDAELQLQVFAAQERQNQHSVAGIRAALAGRIYRTVDRQVLYVGVQAYVAAGGRLDRDLFMNADQGEVVLDTALLDRLCIEKGEPEAERVAREAGYAGGQLKPWGGAAWLPPRPPAGFERVHTLAGLAPDERAAAIAICAIAADGSAVVPTDEGFKPSVQRQAGAAPAAPAGTEGAGGEGLGGLAPSSPGFLPLRTAAAQRAGESELERLARIRNGKIELAALRLAFPSWAASALEGRLFWPPAGQANVPAVQQDGENYAVAVFVTIPKADVARVMEEAEAEVDGIPPPTKAKRWADEEANWPEAAARTKRPATAEAPAAAVHPEPVL